VSLCCAVVVEWRSSLGESMLTLSSQPRSLLRGQHVEAHAGILGTGI